MKDNLERLKGNPMNDILNVVGEPVARVYTDSGSRFTNCIKWLTDALLTNGENLYTEAQLLAAYAKGMENMRERAADTCLNERVDAEVTKQPEDYAYNVACIHCDEVIRALPIEGEQ